MASQGRARGSVRFAERDSTVPSASFMFAVDARVNQNRCCRKCMTRTACCGILIVIAVPAVFVWITETVQPEPAGCVAGYSPQDESAGLIAPLPGLSPPTRELPLDVVPDASNADLTAADVRSWAERRTKAEETGFVASQRQPSPADWSSSIIYEIQVDRFNNGNTTNDGANLPQWQQGGGSTFKTGMRHGGDIWGIRERLPYLKDLGVNTLVLTPVFAHNGEYHGYGTTDLTRIDPGFGSNEEYRLLVRDAHTAGMRVIMDVVVNNIYDRTSVYEVAREPNSFMVTTCAGQLNADYWAGRFNQSSEQNTIRFSQSFFGPFKRQVFFNRCGPLTAYQVKEAAPVAVFGDTATGYWDYDTRNHEFQALFTELLKWWIAFADIDGFRLDSTRHVTEDFIAYFSTNVRAYAHSLGKDNFFVVGDVAAGDGPMIRRLGSVASDPVYPTFVDSNIRVPLGLTRALLGLKETYKSHPNFPLPGMNSLYNLKAGQEFVNTIAGKCIADCTGEKMQFDMAHIVEQLPGYDCCFGKLPGCTPGLNQLWTHIGVNSWPRFQHNDPHNMDLSIAGFAYLLTQPGQPVIYYGQEMGFNGICPSNMEQDTGEPVPESQTAVHFHCRYAVEDADFYRQDMFATGPFLLGSSVKSINKRAYAGKWNATRSGHWLNDPMLDRSHKLYKTARKLIKLRSSCPALQAGQTVFHPTAIWSYGLLAYSRIARSPIAMEAVVIINPTRAPVRLNSFELDSSVNPMAGKGYINVLNGDIAVSSVRDSPLRAVLDFGQRVTLPPYGFAIYMDQTLVKRDEEYDVMTCTHPFEQASAESPAGAAASEHVVMDA